MDARERGEDERAARPAEGPASGQPSDAPDLPAARLAVVAPPEPFGAAGLPSLRDAALVARELGEVFDCALVCRAGARADEPGAAVSGVPANVLADSAEPDEASDEGFQSRARRDMSAWLGAGPLMGAAGGGCAWAGQLGGGTAIAPGKEARTGALPGESRSGSAFDCALVLDALDPWAAAAPERLGVPASRVLWWLFDDPAGFLLDGDLPAFRNLLSQGAVLCASEAVAAALGRALTGLGAPVRVLALPPDAERLGRLAAAPGGPSWGAGTADILAACDLSCESAVLALPGLAASLKGPRPELRWHVVGAGLMRDHLLERAAVLGAWDVMDFPRAPGGALDGTGLPSDEFLAPLVARSNAYLHVAGWGSLSALAMARATGKPVLTLREGEDGAPALAGPLDDVRAEAGSPRFSPWGGREVIGELLERLCGGRLSPAASRQPVTGALQAITATMT